VVASFEASPDLRRLKTPLWDFLAYQTDHAAWVGCSLWDMIQPSFMFMVGAALPFSIASRRAKGQTMGDLWVHAVMRSVALVLLGVFLMSSWTFDNVLTQIGLGYAVSVPAGVGETPVAVRRGDCHPRRVLGRLRALSEAPGGPSAWRRSTSRPTGTASPASPRTGKSTTTWAPASTSGS
jgi:hypothetical protein